MTESNVRNPPSWFYFVDNFMKFYARLFAKLSDIRFDLHKNSNRKISKIKTDPYFLTEPKVRPLPAWSYFVENLIIFHARP